MSELKKILFLCTGNSCRSQMAEGFAKKFTCFQAFSAGTKKSELDLYAVKVMSEIKIDISDQFSKTVNELEDKDFEYVFTLCSDAEENCPILFKGKTIHIGFEDPPKLSEKIYDDLKTITTRFNKHFDNVLVLRKKLEEAMSVVDSFGKDGRSIKRTLENIKDPEQPETTVETKIEDLCLQF